MGFYREEADSISLDIQQFVKGEVKHFFSKAYLLLHLHLYFSHFMETFLVAYFVVVVKPTVLSFNICCQDFTLFVVLQVDFNCDVVLDTGPVTPNVVSVLTFKILSQES